jgi:hypothetical protein
MLHLYYPYYTSQEALYCYLILIIQELVKATKLSTELNQFIRPYSSQQSSSDAKCITGHLVV